MGANISAMDKVRPRKIDEISKTYVQTNSDSNVEFKATKRSTTDVIFLILLAVFLIFLGGLLIYCLINGDIYRIINGYDSCGNVCGRKNALLIKDEFCEGIRTEDKPYQIILKRNDSSGSADRQCVSNCNDYPGYHSLFHRCVHKVQTKEGESFLTKIGLKNFFSEVSEDFNTCWPEFIYLCLISLALSVVLLILFRFLVGMVVWVVLVGVMLTSLVASVTLWIMWHQSKNPNISQSNVLDVQARKSTTYLAFAIVTTIVSVIIMLLIIIMRKRIQLVVQLFKEAGKAIAKMPFILFQPLWTFVWLSLIIVLWLYFTLWIESSGFLTETRPHAYKFKKDGWIMFTRWYNLLAMLWMCQFVIGCQHMVIAGAVSDWYFAKNKNALGVPILKSLNTLIRYHLGSVALGSFLIALVQYIRVVLKVTENYLKKHNGSFISCMLKCCQCCLYCFEKILKYLSRNAYIEIALYGYTFCKAGRQAFKILISNALRVTAINSVGDFVLFLGKMLVVISTVLIGSKMLNNKEALQHMWVPLTLVGLFAYFVAHCFMTVYEMAIDTIFICFCEDCEQNDGISKPYYMSKGLMEFVENSKKALEMMEHPGQKRGTAWQNASVATVSGSLDK